ncbi:hypothetical protein E2320_001463 [Naja naja]|nr:hypothetical protein E2320_001463 [Naja naja]
MDTDSLPEQEGPLSSISNEEDTSCSKVEGPPEQSCVSATEQGSVPDSGGNLRKESTERALGHMRLEDILRPCFVLVELLPIPVPVVVPEKSAELQSHRMTILPQNDLATNAEHPVQKKMRFAGATCDKNRAGLHWQAAAPAPAQSTRKMRDSPPSPLEVPTEKKKLYFCGWCKEPFKLEVNLEVHYRYCRQKQKQQLRPVLKDEKTPGGQDASASSSTGDSAGSAQHPSDDGKGSSLHFRQGQPQQRVVKNQNISGASRGTGKRQHNLTMTISAMKKLYRCLLCKEKFVYKWQLMAHVRGCKEDEDDKKHQPPKPQDFAAKLPSSVETQEPWDALAARPSTSKDTTLYPCDKCSKNLSKCYLSIHHALHEGHRYKCLRCGKVFYFQSAAKRHQNQHYKTGRSTTCVTCGEKVSSNNCSCMIERINVAADLDDRE